MNNSDNKASTIVEAIKSIGIGLVGAGMAGKGITYFSPQLSYDVPRILVPVYKTLGPQGLAVSMILLGVLLLGWSFYTWKKANRQPLYWLLMVGVLAAAIVAIIYVTDNKKANIDSIKDKIEQNSQQSAPAKASSNDVIDFPASFSAEKKQEFDSLVKNLEAAIQSKQSGACWTVYNKLNIFVGTLNPDPNKPEQVNFVQQQRQKKDSYNQQIRQIGK